MSLSTESTPAIHLPTTTPSDPFKRIPDESIRIVPCEVNDAEMIAECIYTCLASRFWDRVEPLSLRPPHAVRIALMAKRLLPTLSEPGLKWIKAIDPSTSTCMGIACWTVPDVPVHNPLRRSAISFYQWDKKMKWSEQEVDDMFTHVSDKEWNQVVAQNDDLRAEYFNGEGHWYLSPVCTWPQFQGKGVGKKLLYWAIEQADATDPVTPLFLESAPSARKFYEHLGFEPVGRAAFVRRGPRVVEGEKRG